MVIFTLLNLLYTKLLKVQKPFSAFFVDDASLHSIRKPICCKANDLLLLNGDDDLFATDLVFLDNEEAEFTIKSWN